jgi:hypothetical protein
MEVSCENNWLECPTMSYISGTEPETLSSNQPISQSVCSTNRKSIANILFRNVVVQDSFPGTEPGDPKFCNGSFQPFKTYSRIVS